jgi:hypothetical protein
MLQKRLEELRREFQSGRELLERLERERNQTHETLLRISGAIQVLEELARQETAAPAA